MFDFVTRVVVKRTVIVDVIGYAARSHIYMQRWQVTLL